MTGRRIGWYVHHHGEGHLTRMLAVRPHVDAHVTVFSSRPAPSVLPPRTEWVGLPHDSETEQRGDAVLDPAASEPTAGGRLHWAPLHHRGHRRRLAAVVAAAVHLDAFVVDVSAEVTALVRLLGLPVVVVTQPGARHDSAHRLAFDLASSIICPWPAGLHGLAQVGDAAGRLHEVGWISRYAGRAAGRPAPGTVLVLGGIGDPEDRPRMWEELHRRFPDLRWRTAGHLPGSSVPDPWELLREAEVVISAAGQNSVADVFAAGRALVLVPQPRPFGEQHATARALDQQGLAVTMERWPDHDALASAMAASRRGDLGTPLRQVGDGARRAARVIEAQLS